jgi:hypothetical protein
VKTVRSTLYWLILACGVGLALGNLFPKRAVRYVPGPPAAPDTVVVTETDTAAVQALEWVLRRQRDRIADLEANQPDNTTVTVYVPAAPDTVKVCQGEQLKSRWYLSAVTAGEHYGDTATATAVNISSDSAGSVLKRQETVNSYATGPLQGAIADSAGYRLLFDPDGFPDPPCKFFCSLKKMGIGAAIGVGLSLVL